MANQTTEEYIPHRLKRWQARFGLEDDPFALAVGEQEKKVLPYYFLERHYLWSILGDPKHPKPSILFARQGEGKTATLEMAAYRCLNAPSNQRAMPVHYIDFGIVLEESGGDPGKVTARQHARVIARLALRAATEYFHTDSWQRIGDLEANLLAGLAAALADDLTERKIEALLGLKTEAINLKELSPRELLCAVSDLLIKISSASEQPFNSIYVLVDRADESSAGIEGALALLRSLLIEGPLMAMDHLAIKFFLPQEISHALLVDLNLNPDRVIIEEVRWDRDSLQKLIAQRLSYYSRGLRDRFEDLCSAALRPKVMVQLVEAAQGSPRRMLQLCRELVLQHVETSDEAMIDENDLIAMLSRLQHEGRYPGSPKLLIGESPAPENGIYIDDSGHTWVDGIAVDPPLSNLEFQLLTRLYHQAPQIIGHEELIDGLWPDTNGEADENNLRKLVNRVRERLEPDMSGSGFRFIRTAKGRGYFLDPQHIR